MTEKIPGGYYLKARIITKKPISKAPPHIREIWDYCLREANHKDQTYGQYTVKRGQLFRTYKDILDGLSWFVGWRKMTYNENHMKTAMVYLRKHLMITTKKQLGGVLITVINYDTYQTAKNYEATSETTTKEPTKPPKNQPSPPDNNKNDKKKEKNNTITKPESVTDQTWSDFLKHRKDKKAPITKTVINTFLKESKKAGMSLEDALIESISRGWRGFKAEWVNKNQSGSGNYDYL